MISKLYINNFKILEDNHEIELAPMNLFLGANSSGKSTVIQSILALKQTLESPIDTNGNFLLNGKYVSLGNVKDAVNIHVNKGEEVIGLGLRISDYNNEDYSEMRINIRENSEYDSEIIDGNISGVMEGATFKLEYEKQKNEYFVRNIEGFGENLVKVDISRLCIENTYILYNKRYEDLFYEFITDTTEKKDSIIIEKDMPFYFNVTSILEKLQSSNIKMSKSKKIEINSERDKKYRYFSNKLIEKFDRVFYSHVGAVTKMTMNFIYNRDKKEEIDIDKYILKMKDISDNIYRVDNFSLFTALAHNEMSIDRINNNFISQFKKIFFIGPLREGPKSLYSRDLDYDPTYVGIKGQHCAYVLHNYKDKVIQTIIPNKDDNKWNPLDGEIVHTKLRDALNTWLNYLGIANSVNIDARIKVGLSMNINVDGREVDITNVGVGVSQILPILVMGLLAPENAVIILQQPELHLHPFVQSRLADFFICLSKLKKQIIAETHSEYMVLRYRYHMAANHIKANKDFSLHFFDGKERHAQVKKVDIDEYGTLDYPEGFKDETDHLLDELLNITLQRMDEDE